LLLAAPGAYSVEAALADLALIGGAEWAWQQLIIPIMLREPTQTRSRASASDVSSSRTSNCNECDEEWREAYKVCREELSKTCPSRSITGGYKDVRNCARGWSVRNVEEIE
jgi:hypothetical protein